jgi:SAM-dependent methyltransferase
MPKSSYDQIANEYYDPRHITSRNFDHATRAAFASNPFTVPESGLILEIGAGRGRANEFLGVPPQRLVQLDNSPTMFALRDRERSLLQVLADACDIPIASQQFSGVVGFLVDPFLGLNSLAEAFRMLADNGRLLLTVPTHEWGIELRTQLGIDPMTTRFRVLGTDRSVVLPSLLHTTERLRHMLIMTGFRDIKISDHELPEGEDPISPDITAVIKRYPQMPVIRIIRAVR